MRGYVRALWLVAALAPIALVLTSCGRPIPAATGEPGSGFPHPEGWVEGHWDAGRANPEACYTCHAEEGSTSVDYLGGEELPPCNGCHGWPLPERPVDDEETASLDVPARSDAG